MKPSYNYYVLGTSRKKPTRILHAISYEAAVRMAENMIDIEGYSRADIHKSNDDTLIARYTEGGRK